MMRSRLDALLALLGLLYCLAVWWPTRDLPYHWDGAMFVARGAHDLLERGFSPLVVGVGHFAHPPLFVAVLAACWGVFGQARLVSHLLVLPFLPLLLASTYLVGKRLYGRAVGAGAAALIALTPVVVSEYGQVYVDLPLAAVATAALALWVADRRTAAGLLFAIAAGIKIPSLIFPGVLIGSALLRRERLRSLWPLLVPFAVVAVWLVYHHAVEGFWLMRPGRRSHSSLQPLDLLRNARLVGTLLLEQQRWAIAAGGLAAGLVLLLQKRAARRWPALDAGSATLGLLLAAGIAFFAVTGEFAQRYGIVLLPPLFLLCAAALHAVLHRPKLAYVAVVVLGCSLFARSWVPEDAPTRVPTLRPDEDLGYLDMIALGRELGAYVQRAHPRAEVFGSVPESYWLTEPFQGYVARPYRVTLCREFRADLPGEKLIVAHLYSREYRDCWQLIQQTGARPVAKLERGGKWLQVHTLP